MGLILSAIFLAINPIIAKAQAGIVQLKKGQQTPYAGVFYSIESHAKLVSKIKGFEARLKLELDFLTKRKDLQCSAQTKALQIDLQAMQQKMKLTEDSAKQSKTFLLGEIKRVGKIVWYKTGAFNFWLGIVLTTGIFALSTYALEELRN